MFAAADELRGEPCRVRLLPWASARELPRHAQLEGRLRHPQLEEVLDYARVADPPPGLEEHVLLATAPREGRSLRALLDAEGRLKGERVARLGLATLGVLEALHGLELAHGDLRPEVLRLGEADELVVCEAGVAALCPDAAASPYAAPEQRAGAPDPRADLFALGACLYEAACRRRPDPGGPIPLRQLRPELPAELERALGILLDPEPRARSRPDDVRQLLAAAAGRRASPPLVPAVEPRFLGRRALLERVERVLDEAQTLASAGRAARAALRQDEAESSLLLVEGDEGQGKTRFLAEAARVLARRGSRVLEFHAAGGGRPYACWRPLVARVARDPACAVAADEARDALSRADLDPQIRHERVARALLAYARARPLALLGDDLHLLDAPSAALLVHLARAAAAPGAPGALAIVGALRANQEASALREAFAAPLAPAHRRASLGELVPAEARDLVASMLPASLAEAEVARLARLGGGNPFLLAELAREWRRGGDAPASVQESLRARLAQLSAPARTLLEGLAVIARAVPRASLARLGDAGADLERCLGELVSLGVLQVDGREAVRFKNGLMGQTLLEELDEGELERSCLRALSALEADPHTTAGERARIALLARTPQAVAWALAAARQDPAPVELYEGAIELMPIGLARAEVQRELAAHLAERGAFAEARRALEGAALDLGDQPPPLELARLSLQQGQVALAEGDVNEALGLAARGREALGAQPDPGEPAALLAQLLAIEAGVATARGDHAGAASHYGRAQAAAARSEDEGLRGRLHLQEAGALVLSLDHRRYPEARRLIAEGRAFLRAAGDARGERDALRALGNLAWYSGEPAEAERCFREALELSEEHADLSIAAGLLNNLGLVCQHQDALHQAERFLERCLDIAERIAQPALLCRAYTNVGRVRRARGDSSGAVRAFQRAADVAHAGGDAIIESAALSELGHCRLAERRVRAGLRALRRSLRLRLTLGDVGRVAESELELGELWRTAGDVRAALGSIVRALALRAALGDADAAAAAVEALEFAIGRPGGPAALLQVAARRLRSQGAPGSVAAALQRGLPLARLALRLLAATVTARAGDVEQAQTQAAAAARALRGVERAELGPGIRELARALEREAQAVVLAARGQRGEARARLEEALASAHGGETQDDHAVRRGALLLKRAFLDLALRQPAQAARDLEATREADVSALSPALRERRVVGQTLVAAALRRAGQELPGEGGSLAEALDVSRRLGDVALLALVAAARAEDASRSGSAQEASRERSAARIAAGRLASGLPESLRRGLERSAAPVLAEEHAPDPEAPDQGALLAMLTRILGSGLELEPLLRAALDAWVQTSRARRGLLALVDEAGALDYRVTEGLASEELMGGAELASTRAVVAHVAREAMSVLLEDARANPRFARGRGTPRSVLALPIRAGEGLVGVVYLDHPTRRARFGEAERSLAGVFAGKLAEPLRAALGREARLGELSRLAEAYQETARELRGPEDPEGNHGLVGRSPAMRSVHRLIERYGRTASPVTIHGESGTGKELAARALHLASPRRDGPFIVLNCAAVPETLMEAELFGAVKGAYTGAERDRQGLFELAHRGTLFLDEVGDMSLEMQAKLLRVLETGELRPVGGRRQVQVDVRIISATHHDLRELVRTRRFREDLLYRLNVLRLELPPLRARREDLPLLCAHFLEQLAGEAGHPPRRLAPAALQRLLEHPFPGNVRELRNALERASALQAGPELGPAQLLLDAPAAGPPPAVGPPAWDTPRTPAYHKTFEHAGVPLNRRQRQLLDHLHTGVAAITNREYCALVEVSERTGLRDLTHLTKHGILIRTGRRKGARYQLAPREG